MAERKSPDQSTWTPGQRAVHHHAGEVWDATRGLHAAYQVDTGDAGVVVPSWDELTFLEQTLFRGVVTRAFGPVSIVMISIAKGRSA